MPANNNSTHLLSKDLYDLTEADKKRESQEQALGMVAPSHPVLSQIAQPVSLQDIDSEHVKDVIRRLYEAAIGQRGHGPKTEQRRTLVGLAAPQIGEPIRIILVDTRVLPSRTSYGHPECFINPEIVWRSRETAEGREGCFSTGLIWGLVRRPVAIKMRAYTAEGKLVERIFEDFTARIAQHEIDHLDGIRFPDRITSDRKRHWVHAEEIHDYPKQIGHWHRLCSKARWAAVKSGE